MTAEREAMTLDQVRDWHRSKAAEFPVFERLPEFKRKKHIAMADAIDAHLRAAEPVYQVRYMIMGSEKEWFEVCRGDFEKLAAFRCDDIVTQERRILYTRPPEPARDANDAARYRWLSQFMSIEDVGDEEMVYALVIDNEGLEDKASRARCWGFAEYHETAPGVDDAIDAAMAQESGE